MSLACSLMSISNGLYGLFIIVRGGYNPQWGHFDIDVILRAFSWKALRKNLQAGPDDVNDFTVDSLNIYAPLVILTFCMLSR